MKKHKLKRVMFSLLVMSFLLLHIFIVFSTINTVQAIENYTTNEYRPIDIEINGEKVELRFSDASTTSDKYYDLITKINIDDYVLVNNAQINEGKSTIKIIVNRNKISLAEDKRNTSNTVNINFKLSTLYELMNKNAVLTVDTGDVICTINTDTLSLQQVVDKLGIEDLSKAVFTLTVKKYDERNVNLDSQIYANNISPIEVILKATYDEKTEELILNNYIKIMAKLPSYIELSNITTMLTQNESGTQFSVPTRFVKEENSDNYISIMQSMYNYKYSLGYNNTSFTDIKGKWYEDVAIDMANRKIIIGRTQNIFSGDTNITRAEFITMLVRGLGLNTSENNSNVFFDVRKNDWYYNEISTAYNYNLIIGREDNKFSPNEFITRQEAALIMYRAISLTKYQDIYENISTRKFIIFNDYYSVSSWAREAVNYLVEHGFMVGADGYIRPKDNITRAESITLIRRLLEKSNMI